MDKSQGAQYHSRPLKVVMGTPVIVEEDAQEERLRRRLERNTWLVFGGMVFVAAVGGDSRLILGVILGGLLGWLNHRWLASSLKAVLATSATAGTIPQRQVALFALRLIVVAGAIALALWSRHFHPLGIVAGFCALIGAVMLEAGYQLVLILAGKDQK
ncbi:MAG TPA: ATP synthase subunit I [Blastocatellia bacterium]|nr:ATP synthase subunit I [Blastocatellia bacterium]